MAPLVALYNATNGTNWYNNENWLSDEPLYEWYGLKVNIDGRVTEIRLGANGLTGTLPPELGELDQLRLLAIGRSYLSGVIPRELGRLTELEGIYLGANDLTGPIPHEIGLLPKLRHIDLEQNRISGELPPSLLTSESIVFINLWDNELTGPIPSEISDRSSISDLRLALNQLSSEIPPEIGRLQQLDTLWLHHNQLTGEIPASIAQIPELRILYLSNNQLTGNIPDAFSGMHDLQLLNLDNNRLTGTIPEGLGDLEQLEQLGIANNNFTGCIPSSLRDVENNNIDFANIEVCGEPSRTEPVIPEYINLEIGDAAAPAETLAIELATQWLNDFIVDIGWPTPEYTINVYVDDVEGLELQYANHIPDCDLECARSAIDYRSVRAERGAVFLRSYGPSGYELEHQAATLARLVFSNMQFEAANQPSWRRYQPDPKWWTAGLATLVGQLSVAEGSGRPTDTLREDIADDANYDFEPLWDLEDDDSMYGYRLYSRHPVGAAAIDLLASQVGLRKLTEFYTARMPGETWKQAFERIFNISTPDFYERFNQHHRDGYPLGELSMEGNTDWP